MSARRLLALLQAGWIALAAMSMPTRAPAATIDADLARDVCPLRLTGAIEPGDLQRLKAKLPADFEPGKGGPTICLNSRGGDFVEGLQIAEFVAQGISTQLEPGAVCMSACSWIFLAGTSAATGMREWSRTMDARASLAFHAPYIDPATLSGSAAPAQTITLAEAIAAYNQAVAEIAQGLLKLAQKYDSPPTSPLVPPTLLAEALVKVGNQLLVVESVGAVVKWRIAVDGYAGVVPRSKDDVARACLAASALANEWPADIVSNLAALGHEEYVGYYDATERKLTAQVVIYPRGSVACELEFKFNEKLDGLEEPITATANLALSDSLTRIATYGDRVPAPVKLPDFVVLPSDTRLKDLPARTGSPVNPSSLVTVRPPEWCRAQQTRKPEEKAVCDSPKLSALDATLNRLYRETVAGDSKAQAQADQKSWLPKRAACGGDTVCLEQAYRAQIAKLRGYLTANP